MLPLSARNRVADERERAFRGRVSDLVEVAVHGSALAHDVDVDAGQGQLGREGLARGAQTVEFGVDHEYRRDPATS